MESLNRYKKFVENKMSPTSFFHDNYIARLNELSEQGCYISMLDTAAQGLSAEAGEFEEIVKKIKYQGKPWNDDNIFHLKRELGDACFYLMVGCIALGVSMEEIIEMNVEKLDARFSGGIFEVSKSETRKDGDV